jgi:DnaJ domain
MSSHDNYKEYYNNLGLSPGCSYGQFKNAYRKLIKKWHPDKQDGLLEKNKDLADRKAKEINIAFNKLSDYFKEHGKLPDITSYPGNTNKANRDRDVSGSVFTAQPTHSSTSQWSDSINTTKQPATDNQRKERKPYHSSRALKLISVSLALFTVMIIAGIFFDKGNNKTDYGPPNIGHINNSKIHDQYSLKTRTLFEVGSSKGEVYSAQGVPTKTEGDTWFYGSSKVIFREGRVVEWEEEGPFILNTTDSKPMRKPATILPEHFVIGSTKNEVAAIQGPPNQAEYNVWYYGASKIYFENNKVIGWHQSPLYPLKAKKLK